MDTYRDTRWNDIIEKFEKRRNKIIGSQDFGFPRLDATFHTAKNQSVDPQPGFLFKSFGDTAVESNKKLDLLAQEFQGEPELLLLHAYTVAHARKRRRPGIAKSLFLRLWREESVYLIENLPPRWLLSSIISFSVYGENEKQRTAGFVFNSFFSLMKLYEVERQYSGKKADALFSLREKVNSPLPVGLMPFSIKNGDLDINTLSLLHEVSKADDLISIPCFELLRVLLDDNGTIFSRLNAMKNIRYKQTPEHTD